MRGTGFRRSPRLMSENIKIVAKNRKAGRDYFFVDRYEAGIELKGTEVKSLRHGNANMADSYARVESGEVYLHNLHIDEYAQANRFNHDPVRKRRLLLHRHEIDRLRVRTEERGLTLVAVRLYFRRGRAKVELALARGKREYDRRREIAKRDAHREMRRELKARAAGPPE